MKLTYFIATLLFLNTASVLGQTKYYSTNFGWVAGQEARKVVQFEDGSYYLAVGQSIAGVWSACIVHVDYFGTLFNTYCNPNSTINSTAFDMIIKNNHCIAVGHSNTNALLTAQYYAQYLQLDITTNELIAVPVDTTFKRYAMACTNSSNGGLLLAGAMHNNNPPSLELHLIKLDSLGVEQWNRTYYAFTGQNTYEDIIALPDGSFYGLATIKDDYWQQANIALLHLSATGIPISIQEYNLGGRDLARCLIPTNDGGLLFSASSYPNNDPTEVVQNLYKLDSAGETQWINNANYFVGAVISSLVQLADSTYIVAGSDYSAGPNYLQGFIAKLDTNGSVLWRRTYGGDRNEYLYDLIINNHNSTGKDGYVMCGRTESTDLGVPLGNANVYLLKTNCMGLLTEPQAQFSYLNPTGNTLAFQNLSQYTYPDSIDGGHYIWDFGDGATSAEINPTHTYTVAGAYNISLTAVVCSDTSRYTQTICVGSPSFAPLFSYQTNNLTATFINQSTGVTQNQGSFIWNFGDGATSVEQNPMHTYTQSGSYAVELQAIVCEDTLVYRQTVVVVATGIEASPLTPPKEGEMQEGEIRVLPNPANEQISINSVKPLSGTFVLYDVLGKEVARQVLLANGTSVKTESLPSGIYLYQIINPQNQILQYGKLSILH